MGARRRTDEHSHAPGRARALRGLSAGLGVVLALAIAELVGAVGLHHVHRDPEPSPALRAVLRGGERKVATQPAPYVGFRVKPNLAGDPDRTDALGLRGGPAPPRPVPGTLRVLLLGGSVAWGLTARSLDETPAALLERTLAARGAEHPALRGQRVEVLNGAVPAYVAWQSALAYSTDRHALAPRVVVSVDGANDISAAIRTGVAGAPMRFDVTRNAYRREEPRLLRDLARWLRWRFERSKGVRLAREWRPRPLAAYGPPPPAAVAAAYGGALEHLADAAAAHGAVALGVLQPMAALGAKPATSFENAVVAHEEARMPGRVAYFRACAGAMRETVARLAAERPDLLLLDATRVFEREPGIAFADPAHLTPRGRARLVSAMAAALLDGL